MPMQFDPERPPLAADFEGAFDCSTPEAVAAEGLAEFAKVAATAPANPWGDRPPTLQKRHHVLAEGDRVRLRNEPEHCGSVLSFDPAFVVCKMDDGSVVNVMHQEVEAESWLLSEPAPEVSDDDDSDGDDDIAAAMGITDTLAKGAQPDADAGKDDVRPSTLRRALAAFTSGLKSKLTELGRPADQLEELAEELQQEVSA